MEENFVFLSSVKSSDDIVTVGSQDNEPFRVFVTERTGTWAWSLEVRQTCKKRCVTVFDYETYMRAQHFLHFKNLTGIYFKWLFKQVIFHLKSKKCPNFRRRLIVYMPNFKHN